MKDENDTEEFFVHEKTRPGRSAFNASANHPVGGDGHDQPPIGDNIANQIHDESRRDDGYGYTDPGSDQKLFRDAKLERF